MTCARSKSTRCVVGLGDVGPDEVLARGDGAVEAADEGVDRAGADGPAGPLVGAVGVDLAARSARRGRRNVRTTWPSMLTRAVADRLGLLEPGGHVVHDHRVLLAVVLGVGEQERQQLARRRTPRASRRTTSRPSCAAGDVGRWRCGSPRTRRGEDGRPTANGAGRQAERGRSGRRSSSARSVLGWSRKSRSSPLTLKIERLGVGGLGAEHARVEQAVEQERGVGGLGGHAGDAADVDVGAAGAVEELEVEVEAARRRGRGRRAAAAPSRRRTGPRRARRPSALRTALAGQRRHEDLGLEAGGRAPGRPR